MIARPPEKRRTLRILITDLSRTMTDIDAGADTPETIQSAEGPGIRILAQFIRDLSFENPRAPDSLRGGAAQPQIDLGVEMNARSREDGLFEVDLSFPPRRAARMVRFSSSSCFTV